MPIISLGTTAERLIEDNKKRTLLTIFNNHASAIVYLSDKPNPSTTDCKWVLRPYCIIIFDGQGDKPERAIHGVSDTASTSVVVGFQNEDR